MKGQAPSLASIRNLKTKAGYQAMETEKGGDPNHGSTSPGAATALTWGATRNRSPSPGWQSPLSSPQ